MNPKTKQLETVRLGKMTSLLKEKITWEELVIKYFLVLWVLSALCIFEYVNEFKTSWLKLYLEQDFLLFEKQSQWKTFRRESLKKSIFTEYVPTKKLSV